MIFVFISKIWLNIFLHIEITKKLLKSDPNEAKGGKGEGAPGRRGGQQKGRVGVEQEKEQGAAEGPGHLSSHNRPGQDTQCLCSLFLSITAAASLVYWPVDVVSL